MSNINDPIQGKKNASQYPNGYYNLHFQHNFEAVLVSCDHHVVNDQAEVAIGAADREALTYYLTCFREDEGARNAAYAFTEKLDAADGQVDGLIQLNPILNPDGSIKRYDLPSQYWSLFYDHYNLDHTDYIDPLELMKPMIDAGSPKQEDTLDELCVDGQKVAADPQKYQEKLNAYAIRDYDRNGEINVDDAVRWRQNWQENNGYDYFRYVKTVDANGQTLQVDCEELPEDQKVDGMYFDCDHIYVAGQAVAADIIQRQSELGKAMFVGLGEDHNRNEHRAFSEVKSALQAQGKTVVILGEHDPRNDLMSYLSAQKDYLKDGQIYGDLRELYRKDQGGIHVGLLSNHRLGIESKPIDQQDYELGNDQLNININRDEILFENTQKYLKQQGYDLNDPNLIILFDGGQFHTSKKPYIPSGQGAPRDLYGFGNKGEDYHNPFFKRLADAYGEDRIYSVGLYPFFDPDLQLRIRADAYDALLPAEKPILSNR